MKYLVTWKLRLGKAELDRLARRPEGMERGLTYVKGVGKGRSLELYRVLSPDEISRSPRPEIGVQMAQPSGIAIVEGASLEEARDTIDEWVRGLAYGGGAVPIQNYVEFEIRPLVDLLRRGET